MKVGLLILLAFCLLDASLSAQSPPPSLSDSITHTSALGFSYTLAADWQVVDFPGSPALSGIRQQTQKTAVTEEQKKGATCVQVAFTGRNGNPASVIDVVQLPFDCLGQDLTEKDLPGFAEGATAQLRQQFSYPGAKNSFYSIGTHRMWVERARGTPMGKSGVVYTSETTCTTLKKGAVCWMVLAADDASLHAFEQGQVVLEEDPPATLVPETIFEKKH